MEENGLRPDQVKQVRGFADQQLRNPKDDPEHASNRRVSVIVQYLKGSDVDGGKSGKKEITREEAPGQAARGASLV